MKEQGESNRLPVDAGDDDFCRRMASEKGSAEPLLGRYAFVTKLFVVGESFDEPENQWQVVFDSPSDADRRSSARHDLIINLANPGVNVILKDSDTPIKGRACE